MERGKKRKKREEEEEEEQDGREEEKRRNCLGWPAADWPIAGNRVGHGQGGSGGVTWVRRCLPAGLRGLLAGFWKALQSSVDATTCPR